MGNSTYRCYDLKILTESNENYSSVVQIQDSENYTIDVSILNSDEGVVCPFDKDMVAGKNKAGEVCLVKKRLIPFLKSFRKK